MLKLRNEKKLTKYLNNRENLEKLDGELITEPLKSKNKVINPINLINIINKNYDSFSLSKEKEIPIIFVDFPSILNFTRFNFKNIETAYYPNSGKIYINRETLETEKNSLYDFMKGEGVSLQDTTNLIILHEMGHAVHHQSQLITKNYLDPESEKANFINNFMSFTEISNSCAEIKIVGRNATREGYADLYASIMFDKIYRPEKSNQAENIITALRNFREHNHSHEHYYTEISLDKYLDERNKLSITDFSDIHRYISKTVSDTAIYCINRQSDQYDTYGQFIGLTNTVCQINAKTPREASYSISKRFPFLSLISNPDDINPYRFNEGIEAGKAWLEDKNETRLKRFLNQIRRNGSKDADCSNTIPNNKGNRL